MYLIQSRAASARTTQSAQTQRVHEFGFQGFYLRNTCSDSIRKRRTL